MEMKKLYIRLLAMILGLSVVLSILPTGVVAADGEEEMVFLQREEFPAVSDDEYAVSDFMYAENEEDDEEWVEAAAAAVGTTEETVLYRLNTLYNLLNGKHFTKNQKACVHTDTDGDGKINQSCSNCNAGNVLGTTWVKNLIAKRPSTFSMTHYGDGHSYKNGWTCCGFANFAGWYLFASKNTDSVTYKKIKSASYSYTTMKEAKLGDIIRLNEAHSAVVWQVNSDGVVVLDSNWDHENTVKKHTILYSKYSKVTISRATNYSSYLNSCTAIASNGGLTVNVTGADMMTLPATAATAAAKSIVSEKIAGVAAGVKLTAARLYVNTAGEYWYKISYNGSTGFVYSGNVTAVFPQQENSALKLPADLIKIEEGAFAGVTAQTVVIPDGCEVIGANAFANSSVKYVAVPASVTAIDATAFDGCSDLTIFGTVGSNAEAFARENNYKWMIM